MHRAAIAYALASAALFGASTPLAKLLVGEWRRSLLAGLLYLGSGIGLLCLVRAAQARRALWRACRAPTCRGSRVQSPPAGSPAPRS